MSAKYIQEFFVRLDERNPDVKLKLFIDDFTTRQRLAPNLDDGLLVVHFKKFVRELVAEFSEISKPEDFPRLAEFIRDFEKFPTAEFSILLTLIFDAQRNSVPTKFASEVLEIIIFRRASVNPKTLAKYFYDAICYPFLTAQGKRKIEIDLAHKFPLPIYPQIPSSPTGSSYSSGSPSHQSGKRPTRKATGFKDNEGYDSQDEFISRRPLSKDQKTMGKITDIYKTEESSIESLSSGGSQSGSSKSHGGSGKRRLVPSDKMDLVTPSSKPWNMAPKFKPDQTGPGDLDGLLEDQNTFYTQHPDRSHATLEMVLINNFAKLESLISKIRIEEVSPLLQEYQQYTVKRKLAPKIRILLNESVLFELGFVIVQKLSELTEFLRFSFASTTRTDIVDLLKSGQTESWTTLNEFAQTRKGVEKPTFESIKIGRIFDQLQKLQSIYKVSIREEILPLLGILWRFLNLPDLNLGYSAEWITNQFLSDILKQVTLITDYYNGNSNNAFVVCPEIPQTLTKHLGKVFRALNGQGDATRTLVIKTVVFLLEKFYPEEFDNKISVQYSYRDSEKPGGNSESLILLLKTNTFDLIETGPDLQADKRLYRIAPDEGDEYTTYISDYYPNRNNAELEDILRTYRGQVPVTEFGLVFYDQIQGLNDMRAGNSPALLSRFDENQKNPYITTWNFYVHWPFLRSPQQRLKLLNQIHKSASNKTLLRDVEAYAYRETLGWLEAFNYDLNRPTANRTRDYAMIWFLKVANAIFKTRFEVASDVINEQEFRDFYYNIHRQFETYVYFPSVQVLPDSIYFHKFIFWIKALSLVKQTERTPAENVEFFRYMAFAEVLHTLLRNPSSSLLQNTGILDTELDKSKITYFLEAQGPDIVKTVKIDGTEYQISSLSKAIEKKYPWDTKPLSLAVPVRAPIREFTFVTTEFIETKELQKRFRKFNLIYGCFRTPSSALQSLIRLQEHFLDTTTLGDKNSDDFCVLKSEDLIGLLTIQTELMLQNLQNYLVKLRFAISETIIAENLLPRLEVTIEDIKKFVNSFFGINISEHYRKAISTNVATENDSVDAHQIFVRTYLVKLQNVKDVAQEIGDAFKLRDMYYVILVRYYPECFDPQVKWHQDLASLINSQHYQERDSRFLPELATKFASLLNLNEEQDIIATRAKIGDIEREFIGVLISDHVKTDAFEFRKIGDLSLNEAIENLRKDYLFFINTLDYVKGYGYCLVILESLDDSDDRYTQYLNSRDVIIERISTIRIPRTYTIKTVLGPVSITYDYYDYEAITTCLGAFRIMRQIFDSPLSVEEVHANTQKQLLAFSTENGNFFTFDFSVKQPLYKRHLDETAKEFIQWLAANNYSGQQVELMALKDAAVAYHEQFIAQILAEIKALSETLSLDTAFFPRLKASAEIFADISNKTMIPSTTRSPLVDLLRTASKTLEDEETIDKIRALNYKLSSLEQYISVAFHNLGEAIIRGETNLDNLDGYFARVRERFRI